MRKGCIRATLMCWDYVVPLIENILKSFEGVKQVSVIVPTRTVIIIHDDLLVSQLQIVSDACRTGSAEAVNELKSMGIKIAYLTGDNNPKAMHVQ
ncbi:hypothetical protein F3Y22_tig00111837pilonHSYRG00674 [Hibiscus syriacus]|uniref:Uncharacterized protein n=1 Tax=Hibiscus syriacus TaxID=106335 RepID=A0A6A2YC40_HIBSY|nr:hypothetical protein F3Y22_tig00111837pilonHSYRG00674 [Hibiscus syriacus]